MVHTKAGTPIVTAAIGEIPIGVDALLGMKAPDGIDPAILEHFGIGLPALRKINRIAQPAPRHHGIDRGWNDIEVAAKDGGRAVFEQELTVTDQAIEPAQFVIELW